MSSANWPVVEAFARLLPRNDREAVLGDLMDAGESFGRALFDVFGLIVRRQVALWKSWRPWLAAFGLALPSSFLLMGFSLSVGMTFFWLVDPQIFPPGGGVAGPAPSQILCPPGLLAGWSWAGGFGG